MNEKQNKTRRREIMKQTKNKTAFTLIELLVVIGILSLLMALLLPALSSARQLAKGVGCMSNLRQMAFAAQMHVDDHDGYYPPAWVINDDSSTAWCGKYETAIGSMDVTEGPLWPYLQGKKIMRCKTFSLSNPQLKYTDSGEISGYGINGQYVAGDPVVDSEDGFWGMTSWARPAMVTQIEKPGETVIFGDCARQRTDTQGSKEEFFIYPQLKRDGGENRKTAHYRHRGKVNVVFCDGHTDSLAPTHLDGQAEETEFGWIDNELMDRN